MSRIIKTYAVNLRNRTDRKAHILAQFEGRKEFDLKLIEAIEEQNGAAGLWKTVMLILRSALEQDDEYIIICEDDHQFEDHYSSDLLFSHISLAQDYRADILSGGVSWLNSSINVTADMYWMERFTGGQFLVIFRKFMPRLLASDFTDNDCYDLMISALSNRKFIIYPFISTQSEFGYSDVTHSNNAAGRVSRLFDTAAASVKILRDVSLNYKAIQEKINQTPGNPAFTDWIIPTYVINLKARDNRRAHIEEQFLNRAEFEVQIIEACEHEIGAVGLWHSIRKVVRLAQMNEDDVIVICEDDHEFTAAYSRDFLLKNVIEAYQQGIEILSGGIGGFGAVIPVTANRLWVNAFLSGQFIVLYKSIFQKILDYQFDDQIVADGALSEIADRKMVLYPFISTQKDFGHSDVTAIHNLQPGLVQRMFQETAWRIQNIYEAMDELSSRPLPHPFVVEDYLDPVSKINP